ncbi:MAG: porin family protein [Paludibacteraceae bacterium]|nr:porin family protein [Paludibacteraceae bacterium]
MKMMERKYKFGARLLVVLLVCFCCGTIQAQDRYVGEFGLFGGDSYYNGDANSTKIFYNNHLAFGGLLRYFINDRGVLKLDVIRGKVSGDTEPFDNVLPGGENVSFEQKYWDVGLHVEHNFLKYGFESWDREVKRHTPYVLIGPGLTMYEHWRGNIITFNLTFGVGYKFKLWKRWNLGFEWSMRKLFVDNFDVVDTPTKILNDPYKMGHNALKNNDYYTCAVAFISVDLIKRKSKCNVLRK